MPPGSFSPAAVEQICRVLGDAGAGSRPRSPGVARLAAPGTGIWPGDTAGITSSAVSSAWLKVPRGELAVIWDLAVAINVGSWRGIMLVELGQRHGIQV